MLRTTEPSWKTYFATLGTISLFPLAALRMQVPQPLTLASLGLVCLVGSFIARRLLRPKNNKAEDRDLATKFKFRSEPRSPSVQFATNSRVALPGPTPSVIVNAFSIDLEEYFHTEVARKIVPSDAWDVMPSCIERSTMDLLDMLDRTETQATVFVLGWVARKQPKLIQQIYDRGHEIACHSDRHRRVSTLSPAEFLEDTKTAVDSIQAAVGGPVQGYRAPSFSITEGSEWAYEVLAELGFKYDSSVYPVYHPTYGNPKAMRFPYYVADCKLLEIPVATWRLRGVNLPVGGGAYLRLLPERYIHAGLRAINKMDREPAMLYVHPWEIDPVQPRLKLKTLSQLRQTSGLQTMAAKLERVLSTHKFGPIKDIYAHLIPQSPSAPVGQPLTATLEVDA